MLVLGLFTVVENELLGGLLGDHGRIVGTALGEMFFCGGAGTAGQ